MNMKIIDNYLQQEPSFSSLMAATKILYAIKLHLIQ